MIVGPERDRERSARGRSDVPRRGATRMSLAGAGEEPRCAGSPRCQSEVPRLISRAWRPAGFPRCRTTSTDCCPRTRERQRLQRQAPLARAPINRSGTWNRHGAGPRRESVFSPRQRLRQKLTAITGERRIPAFSRSDQGGDPTQALASRTRTPQRSSRRDLVALVIHRAVSVHDEMSAGPAAPGHEELDAVVQPYF